MPNVSLLSRPHVEIAIAYLFCYVALDWLSYIHPYMASGITPWNPPTGLSFVILAPMVFTIRQPPHKVPAAIAVWHKIITQRGT